MSRSKLAAVDTSAGQSALMRQLASSCVAGACEARLLPRLPPPLLEDRLDLANRFPCCGLLPRLPWPLDPPLPPDPALLPAPPLPPAPLPPPWPLPDFGLGG